MTTRSCGSCYACCVALGVNPLKKWPNQTCRHLTGAFGPEHRCGIYEQRPAACAHYECAWLQGYFGDDERPDQSGFLISFYARPDNPEALSASVHIVDSEKAGAPLEDSPVRRAVQTMLESGINWIAVADYRKMDAVLFKDGEVSVGKLIRGETHETMVYAVNPIGHYERRG